MEAGDDFHLLEAWRSGDSDAGNALFLRHFPAVNRFFKNKVGGGVEDLVQATFLGCVEGRERFRGDASFRTYLFAVARFQLYAHLRARKADLDTEYASIADFGESPSTAVAKREEHERVLRALRQIPVDFQVALELYYWEDLTGPELATVLDISPHTVRSRLHRARTALKAALEEGPKGTSTSMEQLEGWTRAAGSAAG